MKKLIYSSLILGAAFALASCSADDPAIANGDGTVNITLSLPDIATRALGDTTKCNELVYTVFNAKGDPIYKNVKTDAFGVDVNTATVTIQLVPGETYNVAFYAHNKTSEFSSFNNGVITVDYTKINPNNEIDDAFYYYGEITPSIGQTVSATLNRAFAQLNFGTTDIDNPAVADAFAKDATADLNYKLNISSGIFTTFDMTAENAEAAVDGAITDLAGKVPAKNELFSVPGVSGICSVYLLTTKGEDMEKVDQNSLLEGSFDLFNGQKLLRDQINLANVPVKMNYRTNVYGQLLSSNIPVTVTIDKNFRSPAYEKVFKAETANDLAAALQDPVAAKIVVANDLDATTLTQAQLTFDAPKEIEIADDATLYLPTNATLTTSKDLVISGGTLRNEAPTDGNTTTRADESTVIGGITIEAPAVPAPDGSVVLINMIGGNLTVENATLINAPDYRYHGANYNTTAISYENECNIIIKNSKIYSGLYTICGLKRGTGTENSTLLIEDSYMESFSAYEDNKTNWAYCLRLSGKEATLNNCTVVGIQGGLSTAWVNLPNGEHAPIDITINGGLYYTHKEPGKTPYYAVYLTESSTLTINSGYFLSATSQYSVVSGDNDTDKPYGNVIINGGYFSGMAYNTETKTIYGTPENYKVVNKEYEGMTFKYEWVK